MNVIHYRTADIVNLCFMWTHVFSVVFSSAFNFPTRESINIWQPLYPIQRQLLTTSLNYIYVRSSCVRWKITKCKSKQNEIKSDSERNTTPVLHVVYSTVQRGHSPPYTPWTCTLQCDVCNALNYEESRDLSPLCPQVENPLDKTCNSRSIIACLCVHLLHRIWEGRNLDAGGVPTYVFSLSPFLINWAVMLTGECVVFLPLKDDR